MTGKLAYILRITFEVSSSIAFVVLSFLVLMKVELNSKAFIFLGLLSYEIYLVHMKLYDIYSNHSATNISNNIIYFLPLIILIALLFREIVEKIRNLIAFISQKLV